ncbi:MAG TPA: efflux RND transporter periplasmic adaptor subunit [Gammaproteobacteria bacterium]|nr:efflux RND transporter periplasmic adaptor subunit [Gammaproteobacteria bacterium]
MNRLSRIFFPVVVLGIGIFTGLVLMATGPEVTLRLPIPALPTVETQIVQPQNYQVLLRTQGTVTPRTQSTLIPEVAGRIVSIATNFRNGGSFAAGETLLVIAPTDYENAIIIARADLARAHLVLEQKKALAQNALHDWEKLGRKEQPTDLTLYKPQVASARADMAAAEARLQQAETNLARTKIRAPYAGRVLEKKVDVGQYIAPGTIAATIYAVDAAEVRLPLTDSQLAFVDLPGFGEQNSKHKAAVTLSHRVGNVIHQWQGRLVRTDGAIDTASRQLFVVAQIDSPFQYKKQGNDAIPPLKIGQFVEADIQGQRLRDVFVLPRSAVEIGDTVLVVTEDRHIERRTVQVALRRGEQVVVSAGLQAGERISLTPMPFARDGTAVSVFDENNENSEARLAKVED